MMAEYNNGKPTADNPSVPEIARVPRKKRKRALKLDKEAIVKYVLREHQEALDARDERIQMRKRRYMQLRGWLPEKSFPWDNAANFWIPLMSTFSLRTKAGLENATKAIRPMMEAKALHRKDQMKQSRIDKLLDYQFFTENNGERTLDQYISNFVDDEAVFSFVHWVRREDDYRDIRVLPGIPDDTPTIPFILQTLPTLVPSMDQEQGTRMLDDEGWKWELEFQDEQGERNRARVEFFDRDDGKLEAHISYIAVVYDAPSVEVEDFEDIVFPVRSANLQPPSPENPHGAPWVNRIFKTNRDTLKRGMESGLYDQLKKSDFKILKEGKSPVGSGAPEEESKEQKDRLEGVNTPYGNQDQSLQGVEHYGRWDIDGDGFEEDVIFWVETSKGKLLKAAYLTEMYPGLPIRRPLNHENFIPVPNRIYGISLNELIESIQSIMQMLMNQHIDWGTLTNVPFFFYRAASGMKPEILKLNPGDGIPLDDPSRDVHFPQFATRGESYTINTMTVLQQFAERLSMISDVQFGRVPTGKASAFRTMGTTLSMIGQGDVRSEQVLRRLFSGLGTIYQTIHSLNQRYLPEKKEILLSGLAEPGEDIYEEITPENVNATVLFSFRASMLNTNKQILSQSLSEAMALTISPIAIQAGIVTEQEIYQLMRDKYKAADLDPDKYLVRPPSYGPKILAEEAILSVMQGEPVVGRTLEPPEEHLGKLQTFTQSVEFLTLTDEPKKALLQQWMVRVQGLMQQRQALMAAANQMGGGKPEEEGPGGVPSTGAGPDVNTPAQVQDGESLDKGELQ